jgi:hypothetical protein
MKPLFVGLVVLAAVSAGGQDRQTFTGVITDTECALNGHASMRMGPTDAECVTACVAAHGASYVLVDGKEVYALSDQKTPEAFAARRVRVTGTLDVKTKRIQVESIAAAE